ncbi:hypothetical protein A4A49_17518 [Nicotiana attenuata]|uniref:Uncharacterized protein n=1 Tax=Nicotiana attenuata TaxID=49451 RepID=A0A314KL06_NICAT|nr:hypothetical protein A4A49_17518 [Nicotiana attenuata]
MDEFNKIIRIASVDQYQERPEELTRYMTIINPLLNETHFVSSFICGLKPDLKPLVKLANPVTITDAYEIAKLYEESFSALTALIPARNNQNLPYPKPLAITSTQTLLRHTELRVFVISVARSMILDTNARLKLYMPWKGSQLKRNQK